MKNVLFVILHGSMSKERKIHIKNTWGKNQDCLFYSDYEDKNYNVIKVSDRTDYHSNEEKHINLINLLLNDLPNYEWFFFCDDDTYVNVQTLISILPTLDKSTIVGSVINSWSKDWTLNYCSVGAGFIIHRDLLKNFDKIPILNTGYSDVTLGFFLREKNIKLINSDLFHSQNPKFYNLNENNITHFVTFHYVKTLDDFEYLEKLEKYVRKV